jgi:hypothetical protein
MCRARERRQSGIRDLCVVPIETLESGSALGRRPSESTFADGGRGIVVITIGY